MHRRTLLLGTVAAAVAPVGVAGCSTPSEPVTAIVRIGPAPVEFHVEVAQTAEQQRRALPAGTPCGGHRDAVPIR